MVKRRLVDFIACTGTPANSVKSRRLRIEAFDLCTRIRVNETECSWRGRLIAARDTVRKDEAGTVDRDALVTRASEPAFASAR